VPALSVAYTTANRYIGADEALPSIVPLPWARKPPVAGEGWQGSPVVSEGGITGRGISGLCTYGFLPSIFHSRIFIPAMATNIFRDFTVDQREILYKKAIPLSDH